MSALVVDARGLSCPMPLLKTKKTLGDIASGEHLELWADDPQSPHDVSVFCQKSGHALVSSREQDGAYVFVIQKKG